MNTLANYGSDDDSTEEFFPSQSSAVPREANSIEVDDDKEKPGVRVKDEGESRRKESDLWEEPEDLYSGKLSDRSKGSASSSGSARFEPPPPPRGHDRRRDSPPSTTVSPYPRGFPKVSSTMSLVSYDGDQMEEENEKEDAFAKYDREHANEIRGVSSVELSVQKSDSGTPPSIGARGDASKEPKPPGGRETISDDEEQIDKMIAEGLRGRETNVGDGSPGTSTPQYGSPTREQMEDMSGPDKEEGDVEIPSDAEDDIDNNLEKCFHNYFEKKASGMDMNHFIQNKKQFMNPSIYSTFIDRFGIDEKSSMFSKSLFDPNGFPEDCYYDALNTAQTKIMEKEMGKQKTKK